MAFDLDETPIERVPEYRTWGQVALLKGWEAVWSGEAWLPYDSNIHQPKERRERVELMIIPIDEMQARYNVEQKFNRDSPEWGKTFQSIKTLTVPLGIKVDDLVNRFVLICKKPNGKTYDKRGVDGQPTGEKGKLSDLLFEKIFASQDECVADYVGTASGEPTTQASADAFPVDVPAAQAANAPTQSTPPMDMYINLARSFVKAAVTAHPGDFAAVSSEVAHKIDVVNSKLFAGKLTSASPEVVAMISMEMGL